MNRFRIAPFSILLLLLVAAPVSAQHVSLWAGENNTDDSIGDNDGTIQGTIDYRAGIVGNGFDLSGTGSVTVASPAAGGLASTTGFSIFVYAGQDTFAGGEELVSLLGGGNDSGFALEAHPTVEATLRFRVNTSGDGTFAVLDAPTLFLPQGHFVIATFDAATHTMRVYHGADLVAETTSVSGGDMVLDGDETFSFGDGWDGLIDELSYYARAFTTSEVEELFGISTLIFGDGFEGGSTAEWSVSFVD
jgi:hypothetical protein